jgi:hypothetical protein
MTPSDSRRLRISEIVDADTPASMARAVSDLEASVIRARAAARVAGRSE